MRYIATLCCALAMTVTGVAQANHTIDFTQTIKGTDGAPMQTAASDPKGKTENLTLGDVAVNALATMTPQDQSLSGEEKFKMDQLARKIYKAKSVTLTVEEITLLKTRIGKLYGPTVIGSAWRELDPNS